MNLRERGRKAREGLGDRLEPRRAQVVDEGLLHRDLEG